MPGADPADPEALRSEIAALIARDRGQGPLSELDSTERAEVERLTEAAIEAPPRTAKDALGRAVAAYRAARLRAGEDDVRLAEAGEVFSPEDDA